MENSSSSLMAIKINFAQSHLFFANIIEWVLLFLLVLIVIFNVIPYIKKIKNGEKEFKISFEHIDKIKLPGTIVLTVAYFLLMDYVGAFFPNMGYGFLFVSIPFIFFISLLYIDDLNRKKFLAIVVNSILAPSIAWAVLAKLFFIKLP